MRALEVLVLAVLLAGPALLLRRRAAANLAALLVLLASSAAAIVASSAADVALRDRVGNLLLRGACGLGLGAAGFVAGRLLARRALERLDLLGADRTVQGPAGLRGSAACWAERAVNGLFAAALALALLLVAFVLSNLAAASSLEVHERLARETFVIRYLLLPETAPAARGAEPPTRAGAPGAEPADIDDIDEAAARQRSFFARVGHGFARGRGYVADRTGTRPVVEMLALVRDLIRVPDAGKAWLARTTPGLRELAENDAVRAALADDGLHADLLEVGAGSLAAAYRLAERPSVRRLLDDEEVMRVARSLDVAELRRRVHAREALGDPVPVAWRSRAIARRTELEAGLADPAGWVEHAPRACLELDWPVDRLGLLHAAIDLGPRGQTRFVRIVTNGRIALWYAGRLQDLASSPDGVRCDLAATGGEADLVILAEAATDEHPRAAIEVLAPAR